MQAFVTGSTGLLGSNLVRLLVQEGYHVKALARSKKKADAVFSDIDSTAITIVTGDMQDVAGFASELADCDVLFHTAAYFRDYYQPGDHWKTLEDINVKGTISILTEAEQRGVKKVIYVSSSGVIGAKPANAPGDESTPADSKQLENLYFRSKVVAEQVIDTFLKTHTLPVVFILPTAMFGPGDVGPTGTGSLVLNFLDRKLPGVVDGGLVAVDARDVAQAMLTAVEKGKSGERYIVGTYYVEIADVMKTLEKVSGIPSPTRRIPYTVSLVYAFVLELIGRLTHRPILVSLENVRVLHLKRSVTADKAVRELGAKFRSIEDTLRDEVAWYRDNRKAFGL